MKIIILLIIIVFSQPATLVLKSQGIEVLPAHAHNDYEHDRPLQDALEHEFASVEVDIHLVDGTLLVGHDPGDLESSRTLEALYLDPLFDRFKRNEGKIYNENGTSLILLIDVKTEADATYKTLRSVLRRYAGMLTLYAGENIEPGTVTAIISGNRAREIMENESLRFAAYDGRLEDLENPDVPVAFIPLVSSSWAAITGFFGKGPLTKKGIEKMEDAIRAAHEQGRMIRFWATPDNQQMWKRLHDSGVDLINTDDISGLHAFLSSYSPQNH